MDQKNTIVKCVANPMCLFNHNGACDNYVINIGEDGKCDCYVETATEEDMQNGMIGEFKGYSITKPGKPIRIKLREDRGCDWSTLSSEEREIINDIGYLPIEYESVKPVKLKVAEVDKPNKNKSIIKKNILDEPFDEEYEALFKPAFNHGEN